MSLHANLGMHPFFLHIYVCIYRYKYELKSIYSHASTCPSQHPSEIDKREASQQQLTYGLQTIMKSPKPVSVPPLTQREHFCYIGFRAVALLDAVFDDMVTHQDLSGVAGHTDPVEVNQNGVAYGGRFISPWWNCTGTQWLIMNLLQQLFSTMNVLIYWQETKTHTICNCALVFMYISIHTCIHLFVPLNHQCRT